MAFTLTVILVSVWVVENVISLGINISMHTCSVGDIIQNERIRCICTQKRFYQCSKKEELNGNYAAVSKILEHACEPNKVYVQDSLMCICNKNGTWPHRKCEDALKSLPENLISKIKCEPNTYVRVDCNVCRCRSNNAVDLNYCTKNECEDSITHLKSTEETKLYGDCKRGNWYSLAPCQFCYCISTNKLVCNTGTSFTNQSYLQLGSYNLRICGKNLMKELKSLTRSNGGLLRQDDDIQNTETETAETLTTRSRTTTETLHSPTGFTETSDIVIDVNQRNQLEFNLNNQDKKEDDDVKNVSSSKLDESKSESDITGENERKMLRHKSPSTQMPFEDDYLDNQEMHPISAEREEANDGDESENNIYDGTSDGGLPPLLETSSEPESNGKKITDKNFKLSLLMLLDKFLKMAFGKTMFSLEINKACVPGSIDVVDCNTCFCFNNAMLCTKKKCNPK